jgi:hypothetical protein
VPSLMEALAAREAVARGRVGELRGQLEAAEAEVSRLVITRQTVDEVLAVPSESPPRVLEVLEPVPVAGLVQAAAVLVAAEAGGDVTVTSPAYRQIAAAFAGADGPLRCKDVLSALGEAEVTASQVETMRSKLKRLAARSVLVEASPGLFALAGSGER